VTRDEGRPQSRLRVVDVARLAIQAVRLRRVRTGLSALGIAIGIAAIVGVTGISASSRAGLLAQLDRLGTNLLVVAPGQQLGGGPAQLATEATGMVRRISLVDEAAAVGTVAATGVRRSPFIPAFETGGIGVRAAEPSLLRALDAHLYSGVFLNAATAAYPTAVLGSTAAAHLGIEDATRPVQIWLGGRAFLVIGVLDPIALAPELDRSVFVGWPVAERLLGFDGHPTTIYVRAAEASVVTVRDTLARTTNPAHPEQVQVSRPSDALAARAEANDALTYLLLGLGFVALLVGAIGIVNILLIGVLERRTEIGLRRALGATRLHIGLQFLGEALTLAFIGGIAGCLIGAALTVLFAAVNGWLVDLPPALFIVGLGAALVVGATAGVYPALRAARLAPMEALRASG
jgi:putative ABC transport system permease protein